MHTQLVFIKQGLRKEASRKLQISPPENDGFRESLCFVGVSFFFPLA